MDTKMLSIFRNKFFLLSMWPIKFKINSIDNFKTQTGGLQCTCFTHLSDIYLLPRALHQFIDVYLL